VLICASYFSAHRYRGFGDLPARRCRVASKARSQPAAMPYRSLDMTYEIQPLAFDPTSLNGLSAKLIGSHHLNNYGGAVRRLNAIRSELTGLDLVLHTGLTDKRHKKRGNDNGELGVRTCTILLYTWCRGIDLIRR